MNKTIPIATSGPEALKPHTVGRGAGRPPIGGETATQGLICCACSAKTTNKTSRLPRGWKRRGPAILCRECWLKFFILRAVTCPVAGPVDPNDWPKFRAALNAAWADATRLANWTMTEMAKVEKPRLPADEKLPKTPPLYLYPGARKLVPNMSTSAVVAVLNTAQAKYRAARLDVIWRGAASLPLFRYPVPYPLPAQIWSARWLSDTEHVPLLKVRLGSENFHLRLRGGPQFRRQLDAFAQLIADEAVPCELALYRVRVSESDHRPGLESGGVQWRIMAKLVMWLPRRETKAVTAELTLKRGADALWIAELAGKDPWVLHADHVRSWVIGHAERLRRFATDQKLEPRKPKWQAEGPNNFRARFCLKQNHRLDTFCHTASKMLAEYCVRQKVARVIYDSEPTEYLSAFPWFKLEQLLEYKLHERGIAIEKTGAACG